MSQVSVILVNYKKYEDTVECIKSLEKSTFTDFEIIVVDNNSQNESLEVLNELSCNVPLRIIDAKNNLGFAGANNLGAELASKESKYLFILNNDTTIKEDCIQILVEYFDACKDNVFALTGKAYYYSNPNVLWWAGVHPNEHLRNPKAINKKNLDTGKYEKIKEVKFITGAFMFCRKNLFLSSLSYDADFFFGLEDYELSYRAIKNGYKMVYIPKAVIWHKVGQTRSFNARHIFNAYASIILNYKKTNNVAIANRKIRFYKFKLISTAWLRYKIKKNISLSFKEYKLLINYTFNVMKTKNSITEKDWKEAENFIKNYGRK